MTIDWTDEIGLKLVNASTPMKNSNWDDRILLGTTIASYLREAKAEAFEEAAKIAKIKGCDSPDESWEEACFSIETQLRARAAELRGGK